MESIVGEKNKNIIFVQMWLIFPRYLEMTLSNKIILGQISLYVFALILSFCLSLPLILHQYSFEWVILRVATFNNTTFFTVEIVYCSVVELGKKMMDCSTLAGLRNSIASSPFSVVSLSSFYHQFRYFVSQSFITKKKKVLSWDSSWMHLARS
jgi:hypothetical protein